MLEALILNEIIRTFGTRQDMRIWRANVIAVKTLKGFIRAGVPGQADLTGILNDGRRLEIETKSTRGTQTKEQRDYEAMIKKFNGVYILARSSADVWNGLNAAGFSG